MLDNKAKFMLVDVREPDLFAKERIEGAVNIPMAQLETRLKEMPKDSTLVFT